MFISPVYAQCPVCVVTVGGGLFIAKKLGIDDLIVSIWLSGLNTAIAFWFATFIKNQKLKSGFLWSLILLIFTLIYLIVSKQTGHKGNTFLGVDKPIFGMMIGYILSQGAIVLDRFLRKVNGGKVLFYYQKVIVPFAILLITSTLFSVLIKTIKR